ncbi:MAG TPA: hypothetical protein DCP90_07325 [Clostridiales bacterium]|nr:MAG: hypothetical protein A2Y22_01720 [Clostridiales bacterium GWD2_32_59]HAN10408.1 hypothetical protein [Clostridiales bacterium]
MKIIGLIEDSEGFDTLVTLHDILKSFFKVKVVISFKKILKDTNCNTLDAYFSYLKSDSTDLIILKLKSSEVFHKELEKINFDFLLLSDTKKFLSIQHIATNFLIYNYDNCVKTNFIKEQRSIKCSYGLSYNSDFFPSSIEEHFTCNKIMLCINKSISTLSGKTLEAQEFLIKTNISVESKIYNILSSILCCLLLDVKINDLITQVELLLKEERINA